MNKPQGVRTEQDLARERLNTSLALGALCLAELVSSIILWLNLFDWGSWLRILAAVGTTVVCIAAIGYAIVFQGAAMNSQSRNQVNRANPIGIAMVVFALTALSCFALIIWQSYVLITA